MNNKCRYHSRQRPSNFSFKIISFMHDNPLLPFLVDAQKVLTEIGIKPGQKVLEVGCGPGFFTIPAAEIVGNDGVVYAVDVQPLAIEKIKAKMVRHNVTNVQPMLTNAAETGLSDHSVDLAFVFNLPVIFGGRERLLAEMYRILKPGGRLVYKRTGVASARQMVEAIAKEGFDYAETKKRNFIFTKAKYVH